MIVPTHRLIAHYVYNYIQLKAGIGLDKKWFTFGNVLPDVKPYYIKRKHFYCVSFDYVISLINSLENDMDRISMKEFSLRLGIISHYVSDFFCYPHNDRAYFKGRLKEHMQYEYKLHSSFSSIAKWHICDTSFYDLDEAQIINSFRKIYLEEGMCIKNDIKFTLDAVSAIGLSLSEAYVEGLDTSVCIAHI